VKAKEGEPTHESGWYIIRSYSPKTLGWEDYPRPGCGETWWINKDIAKLLELN